MLQMLTRAPNTNTASNKELTVKPTVKRILKAIDKLDPAIFDDCGLGEVEDTVVDLKDMGQFEGLDADAAALAAIKEIRSLYA
jgi:hypothetical protein